MALALSLAACLAWGLADFLGGLQARRLSPLLVVGVSQLVGMVLLIAVVLPLTGGFSMEPTTIATALIGGLVTAPGMVALYRALAIGPMSIVAPIAASASAVPVSFGLLSGEEPSANQAIGMALALTGLFLVTRFAEDRAGAFGSRRGIAWAAISALLLGIGLVALDRSAAGAGAIPTVIVVRLVVVVSLIPVLVRSLHAARELRRRWRVLAVIGVADVGAVTFFTISTTHGPLSIVAVLASLYPLVTIALAQATLNERIKGVQALGVCLGLIGVVLLAMPS